MFEVSAESRIMAVEMDVDAANAEDEKMELERKGPEPDEIGGDILTQALPNLSDGRMFGKILLVFQYAKSHDLRREFQQKVFKQYGHPTEGLAGTLPPGYLDVQDGYVGAAGFVDQIDKLKVF